MMKSLMSENNSNDSNTSNTNWLGFSLSPHMRMEVASSSSPLDQYHHHHHTHSSPVEVESSNPMFLYPLQHLNTSSAQCFSTSTGDASQHGLVATSSSPPKLENFLSLDSIYYHQSEDQEEANRQQHSLDISYFGDGDLFQAPMVEGGEQKGTTDMSDCTAQISEMPNWVARSYSTHQGNTTIATMVDSGGSSPVVSMASMACGDIQSLTLSMSPGSQSSGCITPTAQILPSPDDCLAMGSKKRGFGKVGHKLPVHRKSIETFGQRTSQYRGVTKHRWTGRYEAHLWDNSCKKEGQTRKGRQVYLGGYDMEEKAARSYDLAALKYWGPSTHTNFPVESYKNQLEEMMNMTRQEYVAHLRRNSSGFSRGASMYRGVTRHHQHGRWQARIGRVAGNKDLYLGTFSTQEEAGEAYDIAAIKFRGVNAVTNFEITRYDVDKIMSSNTLLAGEQAKRIKAIEPCNNPIDPSNNTCSDWKMVLSNYPHQEQQIRETNFSVAVGLHDMMGIDSVNSAASHHLHQFVVDESNKMASVQVSNASSIVTSLNSSREGSPDKSGSSSNILMIPKPTNAIHMAHLPVFAAWNA